MDLNKGNVLRAKMALQEAMVIIEREKDEIRLGGSQVEESKKKA